jgi:menaquinol-cytochrome c reductase iron-sulfur subunit
MFDAAGDQPQDNPREGDGGDAEERRPSPETLTRRDFLSKVSLAAGGLGAAVLAVPVIGYLIAPLFRPSPRIWRQVGPVSQFKVGETVEVKFEDASPLPWAGVTAQTAAWLRRDSEAEFTAFSVHCSHLGCPVNWLAGADLFLCPCHGGVYYKDGAVAAGPPPRPLTEYPTRINNGQVEIQTSPVPIG